MPVNERVARSVALEQAYVHDVYEQFSENPRSRPWPRVQEFLDTLEPGSIICDVGCGNGKYLTVNTSIFSIGGDKSGRLSEAARDKENEVIILDNLALPFRDDSLDAALSIAVVHHLATTERRVCALRELARVLRIGGRIIISVWAMEQTHRKFESQDVLVPWHRPQQLSTPSLELTSTTNTSEDDGLPPYHAYTQSDSDSNRSTKGKGSVKKRGKNRHKGRSIDPGRNSSPSSSSLSSPNETCYSFVRRAIQKLAGGRRGAHRPWFLDSWTTCAKEPSSKRCDPDGCDCCEYEDVQNLPIELRRVDDEDVPQRRQTFPSSQLINDLYNSLKSRSLTDMKAVDNSLVRSKNSVPNIQEIETEPVAKKLTKPKLVKQKKSICDEDEEALDQPTDMKNSVTNLPELKILNGQCNRGSVFKQRSLNEELMSDDRLREKERVRQNIQKQTSLNEELMYKQHHTFDSLKDSFFSVSTSKRFQLIKTGFTNKIKSTNIEKVTGASLKNGFVRMFQNWKSIEVISPVISEEEAPSLLVALEDKKSEGERRHSKEDGSDSSKDSSLQSDTSVDSEDSFASVIFVPKTDPTSPTMLSPAPASPVVKNSSVPIPRIKQSSCPTSPRIKQPLPAYPLTKQLSSPKPSTNEAPSSPEFTERDQNSTTKKEVQTLAQKYAVQQIPKFRKVEKTEDGSKNDRLKKIKDLLRQRPGFGVRSKSNFPIVRHSTMSNRKYESLARPLPKLLALELFNPETDDKDSDSSAVSSPDSVESVISVGAKKKFTFPPREEKSMSLLQAAADVAHSLDEAVDKVIRSSPRAKRRLQAGDVISVIQRQYDTDSTPLLSRDECAMKFEPSWDEECHKHLSEFADKLSEKLLKEIDQYQEQSRSSKFKNSHSIDHIDDPYIHRLSEELQDLSKLSAEIQKQNEYLAKLSVSDSFSVNSCKRCKLTNCKTRCEKNKFSELSDGRTEGGLSRIANAPKLSVSRINKNGSSSIESCDSEKGSSTNSVISSVNASQLFGHSLESADGVSDKGSGDSHREMSRYSDGGSTASLASCPEWTTVKNRLGDGRSSSEDKSELKTSKETKSEFMSDASQESLPSDNIGGAITYHRYYHVFREGELDQLIEKYVQNLHIISSYYDHSSWCVVAEKVQVWTI